MLKKRLFLSALILAACLSLTAWQAYAGDRGTKPITFASSATYTAGATNSSGFLVGAYHEGVVLINVTTVTGAPTLDIDVQVSDDNTTYYHHSRLDTIRITGQTAVTIGNFGKYMRIRHTVAGSTSMVYTIIGVFKN